MLIEEMTMREFEEGLKPAAVLPDAIPGLSQFPRQRSKTCSRISCARFETRGSRISWFSPVMPGDRTGWRSKMPGKSFLLSFLA